MKKRLFSLVLMLSMMISMLSVFSTVASAKEQTSLFTDVNETEYYADSITTLSAQGVISGYEDGSFIPDGKITRAEFAAIICRMIGKESEGKYSKGTTNFDDVPQDHWASGYIYVASQLGIINGYGNGEFDPEAEVKYEEAIKMVVCALGLGEVITIDPNDWSKGYIDMAEDLAITKNLKGQKGKSATRGDMAVMVDYGLQAKSNGLIADILGKKSNNAKQDVKLVYMDELSPSNSGRYTGNEGDSFIDTIGRRNGNIDVNGNKYKHGLTAWVARWNYANEISWVWNEYDIKGEYEYLQGDIVLIKSYNETNFSTKIKIIGDNKTLYEKTLTPSNLPIENLKINVSNVDKLKISVKDLKSVSGGTAFGLANFRLTSSKDYSIKEPGKKGEEFYKQQIKDFREDLGNKKVTKENKAEVLFLIEKFIVEGEKIPSIKNEINNIKSQYNIIKLMDFSSETIATYDEIEGLPGKIEDIISGNFVELLADDAVNYFIKNKIKDRADNIVADSVEDLLDYIADYDYMWKKITTWYLKENGL